MSEKSHPEAGGFFFAGFSAVLKLMKQPFWK
jgi:hypothetical protein